jgi:hypothetical protein
MTLKEWQELRALDQIADALHNSGKGLAETLDRIGDHLMTLRGWPEGPEGTDSSRVNDSKGAIDFFDRTGKHLQSVQVVDGIPSEAAANPADLRKLAEIIGETSGELGKMQAGLEAVKVGLLEDATSTMSAVS